LSERIENLYNQYFGSKNSKKSLVFSDTLEKVKIKDIKQAADHATSAANNQHSKQGIATAKNTKKPYDAINADLTQDGDSGNIADPPKKTENCTDHHQWHGEGK